MRTLAGVVIRDANRAGLTTSPRAIHNSAAAASRCVVSVVQWAGIGADNWASGLDFGAIGQGLGIALGACFARPGKRVTLTADASFMMNVSDFHTAVSHNPPLTVFVFNDNAVGQERHDLIHKGPASEIRGSRSARFRKTGRRLWRQGFQSQSARRFRRD